MIVHSRKPINLAEVKHLAGSLEDKKLLEEYLKKFSNLSRDKAEKLSEEIRALNNLKIKEDDIVKVVDFLPKDSEELNKIFSHVSLSEEETNAIISITTKY